MFVFFCKSVQPNHLKEPFQKKTLFAYQTSPFLQNFSVFSTSPAHFIQTRILFIVACVIYACVCVCVWC